MSLPTDSKARKELPVTTGVLDYFPDAITAVAAVSKKGNERHNPGEPLHWSREKSADHRDCIGRHLIDAGPNGQGVDENGDLHLAACAWRALAALQLAIEAQRSLIGWIEWHGGECPVPPETMVRVKLRADAQTGRTPIEAHISAGRFRWNHTGDGGDIVAYKVVG